MTRFPPEPSPVLFFLCCCCVVVAAAEGGLFAAKQRSVRAGLGGFEPGDPAPAFRVPTLDGEFVYPPQDSSRSSLIIHAFTNKSAFLECLWTSNASLADLSEFLPPSAQVLILSTDDSAAEQALWMREQVYGATGSRWGVLLGGAGGSSVV